MAEFIEREAALASIRHEDPAFAYAIMRIPAADVRPVVLCKDCMHWEYDAIFVDGWCRVRRQGNPNWFCADGEKKEES